MRHVELACTPRTLRARVCLVLFLALGSCGRPARDDAGIALGGLRLRLRAPAGWEHLDHGRQQLFRSGERQISLSERAVDWDTLHAAAADSEAAMLRTALGADFDGERFEIARREERSIAGLEWTDLETWSRLTHLQRRRVAYALAGDRLLVLDMDRGDAGALGPVFESLLASIEPADGGPPGAY
jgi:hypothetical protein